MTGTECHGTRWQMDVKQVEFYCKVPANRVQNAIQIHKEAEKDQRLSGLL